MDMVRMTRASEKVLVIIVSPLEDAERLQALKYSSVISTRD